MNVDTGPANSTNPADSDPTTSSADIGGPAADTAAAQVGRVRVALTRTGGVLGVTIRRALDTADLPVPAADRLRALTTSAIATPPPDAPSPDAPSPDAPSPDAPPPDAPSDAGPGTPRGQNINPTRRPAGRGGADRFSYVLEIEQAGHRTVLHVDEPLPSAIRPLLDLLRTAPTTPRTDP
ncbi:hypothetical protein MXD61_15020 [Frankia sp. AgPm24]|uniref:protealysin inhibitor emfourin n=1 Tax=Frankia sp. AgPm24 TaxID=631128 RepID=UPI002010BB5F|nr:protealysin inhibitor emfourin [Frankia sp. AgPm24]MCK9923166.1 hypothetical protein [Frankia sp. AgPm24]